IAAPPDQWKPVDQGVGDIDAMAVSMRRVEAGLRYTGEQTNLYEVDARSLYEPRYDRQQVYYRIAPGYLMQVDRLDYLVKIGKKQWAYNITPIYDGKFLEIAPTTTIYELRAPQYLHARKPEMAPDNRIDGRVDGRVDARLGNAR